MGMPVWWIGEEGPVVGLGGDHAVGGRSARRMRGRRSGGGVVEWEGEGASEEKCSWTGGIVERGLGALRVAGRERRLPSAVICWVAGRFSNAVADEGAKIGCVLEGLGGGSPSSTNSIWFLTYSGRMSKSDTDRRLLCFLDAGSGNKLSCRPFFPTRVPSGGDTELCP